MSAADPNFFICLLLGGLILYGLMPAYGAFALALAALWLLGKAPLLFLALAGLWLVRKLIIDFLLALVTGLGFGLGFGRARRSRIWSCGRPRYPRRRHWSRAALNEYDAEGRRAPPRLRGR